MRALARIALLLLAAATLPQAPATQAVPAPAATTMRRAEARSYSGTVDWSTASVLWFGRADISKSAGAAMPGRNYVDVRIASTPSALKVFVSIIDYYLWSNTSAGATADQVRSYDAIELFLDTAASRSGAPQPEHYRFLSGYGQQRHQARGQGGSWDTSWAGAWSHQVGDQWSTGGPNNNGGNIDYGWASTMTIPWSTLGLSGPPAGQVLGMGLRLYDRDSSSAGGVAPILSWPEALAPDQPSSWGDLSFGAPSYAAPLARSEGHLTLARGLPGATVADATVGANGGCINGHEGEPDSFNQGDDTSLYVESQSAVTDFPCFARSYLRFNLDGIPPGKVVISATLTLYHWSQSGSITSPNPADRPSTSLVQVLQVDGGWSESTITWNSGPLARQSLAGVSVPPRPPTSNLFPGVPYRWDVTAGVADAYARGQPLDLAVYTSDTEFHSNKYFTSSETGDWNAVARPTLRISWGAPVSVTSKVALPLAMR